MIKQRICSYRGSYVSDITDKMKEDSERFDMPVKDVSLTSHVVGSSSYYYAIAVFEEEQELAKRKEVEV